MKQEVQSHASQIATLMTTLNEAYSNNQLDGYRVLELKNSLDERTTCKVQWGPMMRA